MGPPDGRNSRVILRHFVAGPENRLVEVAVRCVLHATPRRFNPVVLYGPPGTGKSHIAAGLAAAWKVHYPHRPVVYITAIDFAREWADAVETQTAEEFGNRHRQASLLVLEDIGHLADKLAAQRELLYTFDELAAAGSRIVVTAPAAPGQLAGIMPGFESRLSGGLTVPLVAPGPEARLTILQRLAELHGVELPQAVAGTLSDGLCATVPELFAAVVQLAMQAQVDGGQIGSDRASRYVARRNRLPERSVHEIALATAGYFSLKLAELQGPSRRRAVVTARGVAMYLARNLTQTTLQQIGHYFGGRDHTTVSYGCRKTERLLKTDPTIRQAVLELQDKPPAS